MWTGTAPTAAPLRAVVPARRCVRYRFAQGPLQRLVARWPLGAAQTSSPGLTSAGGVRQLAPGKHSTSAHRALVVVGLCRRGARCFEPQYRRRCWTPYSHAQTRRLYGLSTRLQHTKLDMKTPMSIASTKKTTASADELPKRPGVFVMASSRRPLKPPKSPSAPATPRVAAPRATTPNTLRPSVTARSPISPTTRNRADSLASHDGHASAPVRPPLAVTGSRPLSTNGARLVAKAQHPPSYPSNASPRFFHASEVNVGAAANQSAHVQASPSPTPTAKFFTADSLKPTSPTPPSHVPHVAKPTRSSLGAPQGAMPENRPSSVVASSSSHRSSRVSSSDSAKRPPSLATTTAPDTRNHVKFVYANGAEEILAPRNNGSEIGSATSSPPQLPSLPSSPKLYSLPISSPGRQSFPQSPLSSPNLACPPQLFAHQPLHSHSRRSSIDTKERHERAASIGSTIDAICLLEEDSGLDEGVLSKAEGLLEGNSQPVQSAAARIKAMEEAAADARRERKVRL